MHEHINAHIEEEKVREQDWKFLVQNPLTYDLMLQFNDLIAILKNKKRTKKTNQKKKKNSTMTRSLTGDHSTGGQRKFHNKNMVSKKVNMVKKDW